MGPGRDALNESMVLHLTPESKPCPPCWGKLGYTCRIWHCACKDTGQKDDSPQESIVMIECSLSIHFHDDKMYHRSSESLGIVDSSGSDKIISLLWMTFMRGLGICTSWCKQRSVAHPQAWWTRATLWFMHLLVVPNVHIPLFHRISVIRSLDKWVGAENNDPLCAMIASSRPVSRQALRICCCCCSPGPHLTV